MENLTIEEYISSLKSASPTPGGGSANCLISKIAASLALMAINVSKNRKTFQAYDMELKEQVAQNCEKLEKFIKDMDDLAERDENCFKNFMIAYRSKNSTEIKQETINCFNTSYAIFLTIEEIITPVLCLKPFIVSSIISDYKISLETFKAALKNAIYNVEINSKNSDNEDILQRDVLAHKKCKNTIKMIDKIMKGVE